MNKSFKLNLLLIALGFIFINSQLNAQQEENSMWYFGFSNTGIHFDASNSFAPVAVGGKFQPYGKEGSLVVTNGNGKLQFYTDGIRIVNRENAVMPGGNNIGSCGSVAQAASACEVPGQIGQYYLFVNDGGNCSAPGLRDIYVYVVDMTAGAIGIDGLPLGAITPFPSSSNILRSDASESIVLVPKPCSNDFWLVGKVDAQNQMYCYLIDENFSLATNPNLQTIAGLTTIYASNMKYGFGKLIGTATSILSGMIYKMDFDADAGVISAYAVLDSNIPYSYDAAFSPDGTKLYYSGFQQMSLRQYDFNTSTINTIWNATNILQNGGGLKLGPDGKMYYLADNLTQALSVISNPNASAIGNACGFAYNPISFGTGAWGSLSLVTTVYPTQNVACTTIGAGGTISGAYASNQVYCINNNVSVSGLTSLSDSEIRIAKDVIISVPNNATLNLRGVHLYSPFCDMWNAISIYPGGKVDINSSASKQTLFEDSYNGVNAGGTASLSVQNTTFNRNNAMISIVNMTGVSGNYPVTIKNNIFTCRDIPFSEGSLQWPNKGLIAAPYTPPSGALGRQFINDNSFSPTTDRAFLKGAYYGLKKKPLRGILIGTVGNTQGDFTTNFVYKSLTIGEDNSYNVFDNMVNCINILNSNVILKHNVFQNTIDQGNSGPEKGTAISTNSDFSHRNQLIVGGNSVSSGNVFVNCYTGIFSISDVDLNITNNTFRSTQIETTANPTPRHQGKEAIVVSSHRFKNALINKNTLYNIESGIQFLSNFSTTDVASQFSGKLEITFNQIGANQLGQAISTQYVRQAIRVENSVGSAELDGANTKMLITDNTLDRVIRGIVVSNWRKKEYNMFRNKITLNKSLIANDLYFGIQVNNNLTASGSLTDRIMDNKITGFAGYATETRMKGIDLSSSPWTRILCNDISSTYGGLVMNGSSGNTQCKLNKLQNHQYGFMLDNSAVLGNQGSTGSAADNSYNGTWPAGTFMTATFNGSSSQNNKMYVHNAVPFNPESFGFTDDVFSKMYDKDNGSIIYSTAIYGGCFPALPLQQGGPATWLDEEREHIRRVINHEIIVDLHQQENERIAHQQIYTVLALNPELLENDAVLQAFYQEHQNDNLHRIHAIEQHLSARQLAEAQVLNAGMQAENAIETNYQNFNAAYIHAVQDSITPIDSLQLDQLSRGCPFTNGMVVYQARALYQRIYRTGEVFADNCPEKGQKSLVLAEDKVENMTFELYPNPANQEFFVKSNTADGNYSVQVTDMFGRNIEVEIEKTENTSFRLKSSNLSKGIYLITITNTKTNENSTKKISIQH